LPLIRLVISRTRRAYIVLVCAGEVMLIKNWLSRDRFWLPGGGVHRDETMVEGAVRETLEELGVRINVSELVSRKKGFMKDDRLGFEYEIFVCHLAGKPVMKIDKGEIVDNGWYSYAPEGCSKLLVGIIGDILV
jgi:8-oxo-dGTP pyrophosphatase MutT (NUDIX family)